MYNVVLWGLGKGYDLFTACKGHDMVHVVAIADSCPNGYSQIDGAPIIKPEDICKQEYDYLIITVSLVKSYTEIMARALELGIKRETIIPSRVFEIPFFNFDDYIKIKESNISLLSNTCFAGLLYYRFGLKRLSPTINILAVSDESYLNFLKDVKGHLTLELGKVENVVENPLGGFLTYPRGRLGDSEWAFPHDETFEIGADRWKRGTERFNYDNYVAFMAIGSDEAAYEFDALPIKHKLGFYWKDLNLKSVIYMPEWSDYKVRKDFGYEFARGLVNNVADGREGIIRRQNVDWIRFLLLKDDFLRKR